MSKTILILVLSFIFTSKFSAQATTSAPKDPRAETERLKQLLQEMEGTYQMQIVNSREKPTFPLAILDTIAARRHKTEVVFFWLKSNTRIKVLPESVIYRKDFVPLPRVAHIESEETK